MVKAGLTFYGRKLSKHVTAFARAQNGATAIEYALIASMIALAIFATLSGLGTNLINPYQDVNTGLQ